MANTKVPLPIDIAYGNLRQEKNETIKAITKKARTLNKI